MLLGGRAPPPPSSAPRDLRAFPEGCLCAQTSVGSRELGLQAGVLLPHPKPLWDQAWLLAPAPLTGCPGQVWRCLGLSCLVGLPKVVSPGVGLSQRSDRRCHDVRVSFLSWPFHCICRRVAGLLTVQAI